ncbi:MAG: hypothetical protein Q7R66_13455 [Undibacterium sp.]|uniref:hypothetical protein n=1 Tax=Undibacterium sp. TaxID=1914977 RepID=UPI00271A9F02|nr:hypothetical protein [Undibacterium sp.]MDO8653186.1 hypothetical protein [Undibacterium sp.]
MKDYSLEARSSRMSKTTNFNASSNYFFIFYSQKNFEGRIILWVKQLPRPSAPGEPVKMKMDRFPTDLSLNTKKKYHEAWGKTCSVVVWNSALLDCSNVSW